MGVCNCLGGVLTTLWATNTKNCWRGMEPMDIYGRPSRRVTRVLDEIIEHRGEPRSIRCDNGPELTSRHFLAWCIEKKIELVHIQPGKPTQTAHIESFHGRLREEF